MTYLCIDLDDIIVTTVQMLSRIEVDEEVELGRAPKVTSLAPHVRQPCLQPCASLRYSLFALPDSPLFAQHRIDPVHCRSRHFSCLAVLSAHHGPLKYGSAIVDTCDM